MLCVCVCVCVCCAFVGLLYWYSLKTVGYVALYIRLNSDTMNWKLCERNWPNLFSHSKLTLGPPVLSKAIWIQAGAKTFVLLLKVRTGSGDHRCSFQGVKRPGRGVDNWQFFSTKIKNECSYIPLSPYVPSEPAQGQFNLFWIPLAIMTRFEQHISICKQSSFCIIRKRSLYKEIANNKGDHMVKNLISKWGIVSTYPLVNYDTMTLTVFS